MIVGIVSIFFSMCGITGIIAIVLSSMGLSQIKTTGEDGKGMGIAGIVTGGFTVAINIIVILIYVFAIVSYGY